LLKHVSNVLTEIRGLLAWCKSKLISSASRSHTKRAVYDVLRAALVVAQEAGDDARDDALGNTLSGFIGWCAPAYRYFPDEPDITD